MPVVSGRLNTAVADSGTITIPYPAGVKLSDIDAFSANHALVLNDNDVYPLSGGKFSVAFTPTAAVITNSSGTSWGRWF